METWSKGEDKVGDGGMRNPTVAADAMRIGGVGSHILTNLGEMDRELVRRSYRRMRREGMTERAARWALSDLLLAGMGAGIGFAVGREWAGRGSNPRISDYESGPLTTEVPAR